MKLDTISGCNKVNNLACLYRPQSIQQGRSEGVIAGGGGGGGGGVEPPNIFRINIFGKSGWPSGKLRQ